MRRPPSAFRECNYICTHSSSSSILQGSLQIEQWRTFLGFRRPRWRVGHASYVGKDEGNVTRLFQNVQNVQSMWEQVPELRNYAELLNCSCWCLLSNRLKRDSHYKTHQRKPPFEGGVQRNGLQRIRPMHQDTRWRLVGSTRLKMSDFYSSTPQISRSTFPFHRISYTFGWLA
jgi:hypothetical protein